MATRSIPNNVRSIMDSTMDLTDPDIQKYINTANLFLANVFSSDAILGASLMKEVETWYSAHLIAMTRMRMASREEVGDAGVTYLGKTDQGLESTPYGQMVLDLDTSGKIKNESGKRPASIYAVKYIPE